MLSSNDERTNIVIPHKREVIRVTSSFTGTRTPFWSRNGTILLPIPNPFRWSRKTLPVAMKEDVNLMAFLLWGITRLLINPARQFASQSRWVKTLENMNIFLGRMLVEMGIVAKQEQLLNIPSRRNLLHWTIQLADSLLTQCDIRKEKHWHFVSIIFIV